ncbi:MFS general substrate transporter [Neocallimastix californiae]|jgi:predicted MFS family arabinose efflux permease|uniref:MFS general substrate transporter n=1 Tax=Neocallimastix californiae TaxID=1754190 RepID=A0A1Y2CKI7_9FUNG|nr:MFS general substrate transporter [Neocallimastix californiae]|eukprot:ORY47531.1 MFS general substrate transporter [Neocallimastix californiae]
MSYTKTVFITDADQDIGLAWASYFAKKGYEVIGTTSDASNSNNLEKQGAKVIELDIKNENSILSLPSKLKGQKIDLLINNIEETNEHLSVIKSLLPNIALGKNPYIVKITSNENNLNEKIDENDIVNQYVHYPVLHLNTNTIQSNMPNEESKTSDNIVNHMANILKQYEDDLPSNESDLQSTENDFQSNDDSTSKEPVEFFIKVVDENKQNEQNKQNELKEQKEQKDKSLNKEKSLKFEKIWNYKFILLFITNFLMMATFYAAVPIIPIYCQEIGITGSKIGVILTAMSVTIVLFRPVAGYILDNFNRYRVFVIFLTLLSLPYLGFAFVKSFVLLVFIRLYTGIIFSVSGSSTLTLAGDLLPVTKIREGINRFALTISLGMAAGPFVGIQVQDHVGSRESFLVLFALSILAIICVSFCKIPYPPIRRKRFRIADSFYRPALPFMFNMIFIMVPFGSVLSYSSIFAQELGISVATPYFYVCLVAGMLVSKFSTQKLIDQGRHKMLVYTCLLILMITLVTYYKLSTITHFLISGVFLGGCYGILQPLFQSFVTSTSPPPKRGVANATYLLSYDIGIGIGVLLNGFFQEKIGLNKGFALNGIPVIIGCIIYGIYTEKYYCRLKESFKK